MVWSDNNVLCTYLLDVVQMSLDISLREMQPDTLIKLVYLYRNACIEFPDAEIEVSR